MVFEKFGWHKPLEWIHRISVPLMILGVLLSTLHQSSLGTLFLIVPEKLYPLWYTPILPLLFCVSAIAVGLAMTIFESWHCSRAFGRALELPLLASMGTGAGGGDERVPVDPFPGHEPPPCVRTAGAEPDRDLAVRARDRADGGSDGAAVSSQGTHAAGRACMPAR